MVSKSGSAVLSLLVFILVEAIQDVPCVSARNLLQSPSAGSFDALTNPFGANGPSRVPGLGGIASGLANGIGSAASNAVGGVGSAFNGVVNGASNVLGAPPLINNPGSSNSAPASARTEETGTTIAESFYISTTGLGSITVTATTHIPPIDPSQIHIPDFKTLLTNIFKTPSPTPSPGNN